MSTAIFVLAAIISVVAATNCHTHPWPHNNALTPGQSLSVGQYLQTSTSYLIVEATGSATIYRGAPPATDTPLWSTNTGGSTPAGLEMTLGGNLVLTSTNGSTIWQSGTSSGPNANFVLQEDCNFVLYLRAPLTNATWATGTVKCIVAHIVPHSHDDVGWLLTPERYYDGCYDPTGGVQSIISSTVDALAANSTRTFAQVESYFFNRWWVRQSAAMKAKCRSVVASGQFQFINGGWSMHDEACVHQESAVSNMEVGAQFLRKEFGNTMNLTVGWHIDPFGHASATPRLMAQMGFDSFFFWREDYEMRNHRLAEKTMETMWSSSPSLGDEVLIFTSILYNSYCYGCEQNMCPSPFCCMDCEQEYLPNWAHYFGKIKAMETRQTKRNYIAHLFRLNKTDGHPTLQDLASSYVDSIKSYSRSFRTNQVMMPWGCDFEHIDASISFALMDSVIEEVNGNWAKYGVTMKYSTPDTYVEAVHGLGYSWPTNEYDYFLDSDDEHSYWSGYFSSRAEYKHFERWLMNERVAVEVALSAAPRADFDVQRQRVDVLRQALGVAQHHDSITGTEREHVRDRYHFLLTEGLMNASAVFEDVFQTATGAKTGPCLLSNISSCDFTNPLSAGAMVSAFIFNPVAWPRKEIITIPVPTKALGVLLNGAPVVAQVSPTWALTTHEDPTAPPHSTQPYELIFSIDLPPLSLLEVVLTPAPAAGGAALYLPGVPGALPIVSDTYSVAFDAASGRISNVTNRNTGLTSPVDQNALHYCPMSNAGGQASGAYIFRTCEPDELPQPFQTTFSASTIVGPVCSEVRQVIDTHNAIHQTVRLCNGQEYVDLITGIGQVDPGATGKEVIMRIGTDIQSSGEWFTDSQGLELQRRLRNAHPNYPYTVTEPIAANFYPCNVFSMIQDSVKSLAVITDYSRATSSLHDGELEFLFIRRLVFDDHRGVDQPLNESIRVISSSRLVFNSASTITDARKQAVLHTHKPIVRFGGGAVGPVSPAFSGAAALPPAVALHTRTAMGNNWTMIRLQHIYAAGEGPLAVPVEVDLAAVAPYGSTIVSVVEMDLNGISPLEYNTNNRRQFSVCDSETGTARLGPTPIKSSITSGTVVKLRPMDLRTYMVQLTW